ncbi:DNA cytosine methyltransferase [Microbacterium sp. Leaf179]|uniref:DNA cytosine methyltransferase n=1 Tax=Microbacterium sp. Leaf179 TaxID=1736288 RepID=UPI0009EB42D4|nr:DNA cytosine methyltransferase [Microbacterium sp. Leaf179]
MSAPRLLDLFCCAGGASTGYARAGYRVYGVDIVPRPNYPFPFHQGDALDVLARLIAGEAVPFTHPDGLVEWLTLDDFAAVAASPPCQAYSITRHMHTNEHPELVDPTRELLEATGLPWIMENVPGAPLREFVTLCGSMFNLSAFDEDGELLALRRHRLFESNVYLMMPGACVHDGTRVAGVYGGGATSKERRSTTTGRRVGYTPHKATAAELMGIDWMTLDELAQAIPPAYTEFLGRQLLNLSTVDV